MIYVEHRFYSFSLISVSKLLEPRSTSETMTQLKSLLGEIRRNAFKTITPKELLVCTALLLSLLYRELLHAIALFLHIDINHINLFGVFYVGERFQR